MSENYFTALSTVDVSARIEKKGGLSYLSWPFAWGELKKRHPEATYTVYENAQGWNYHTDGNTAWVKVGVTVECIEHVEHLPIMDSRNKSIPLAGISSFDVNKSIQRALTKAIARHGLGLYVYAGEDLPDDGNESASELVNVKSALIDWLQVQPPIFTDAQRKYAEDAIARGDVASMKKAVDAAKSKAAKA